MTVNSNRYYPGRQAGERAEAPKVKIQGRIKETCSGEPIKVMEL